MQIQSAQYIISSPDVDHCPKPDLPEYAFIGRSNVGKSSLINMLAQRRDLARVSATPGKTQLINHYLLNKIMYWVDLPGYGFAKVSIRTRKAWVTMIETYVKNRPNLMCLFVLIDGRHNPQAPDLEFIRKLGEWKIPFALVFTKADKENQRVVQANVRTMKETLLEDWEELPPLFVTSAVKGLGRREILAYMSEANTLFTQMPAPIE